MDPEAIQQLHDESKEKANQGFVRMVNWNDIKDDPPRKLKVSPICAVPHKSCKWHMILNLSQGVMVSNTKQQSVNEATAPNIAPAHSMAELGNVLPRIIYAVGTAPESKGPVLLSKNDILDGFWRLVVSPDNEWNFAYVLPKMNADEPTMLMVPSCLQMGWCSSPAYLCAASETAQDVAEVLSKEPVGDLPPHPFEHHMLPPDIWGTADKDFPSRPLENVSDNFLKLIEVYIDDFIGLTQTTDPTQLLHLTRALLKASHSIFPSPDMTGHNGLDPVSLKKLLKGDGLWEVCKEILGWIIDGMHRCIEYPKDKLSKLTADLKVAYQSDTITAKTPLQKLRGRMRHASIGMPAGRPLCGLVDKALTNCKGKVTQVKSNKQLKSCFQDFQTLLLVFC